MIVKFAEDNKYVYLEWDKINAETNQRWFTNKAKKRKAILAQLLRKLMGDKSLAIFIWRQEPVDPQTAYDQVFETDVGCVALSMSAIVAVKSGFNSNGYPNMLWSIVKHTNCTQLQAVECMDQADDLYLNNIKQRKREKPSTYKVDQENQEISL